MSGSRPRLSAGAIAARRLVVGALDRRRPATPHSLPQIVRTGLQDSWPRAALLSLHARMEQVGPRAWEDPPLVQVWGPRFNVYVVTADDAAVFTVGRQPPTGARRELGIELADRLEALLGGDAMPYREAGRALGVDPNQLRYAALTGRLRVRWEGAGAPLVWTVAPPEIDADEARRGLARRFLHVLGPSTSAGFAKWAGIREPLAAQTFHELGSTVMSVDTDVGDAVVLADDLDAFLTAEDIDVDGVRLLPSGDSHVLRWGTDRELQVPDPAQRDDLWTSRVWPGAVLVDGQLAGTWRRSDHRITPWRALADETCDAVAHEARSLPLPGLGRPIDLSWNSPLR